LDPFVPSDSVKISNLRETATELKDRAVNFFRHYFPFVSAIRRLNKKEGAKFNMKDFAIQAQDIYEKAYIALAERNKDDLHRLITEHAFAKMWPDVERGTLFFELIGFKKSKVVVVRVADYPYKSGNDIAQVTVRMHSVQKYALYDRFGRLLIGSPKEEKEVVEYVVFENHIGSMDGEWRLHDKIYTNWLKTKDGILRPTLVKNADAKSLLEEPKRLEPGGLEEYKKREEKLRAKLSDEK